VSISRLESGAREPTWSTVEALCVALGVDPRAFQGTSLPPGQRRGPPPPPRPRGRPRKPASGEGTGAKKKGKGKGRGKR
jgi:hypothetical protein